MIVLATPAFHCESSAQKPGITRSANNINATPAQPKIVLVLFLVLVIEKATVEDEDENEEEDEKEVFMEFSAVRFRSRLRRERKVRRGPETHGRDARATTLVVWVKAFISSPSRLVLRRRDARIAAAPSSKSASRP